ncbi:MAG TPA: hypothetical protein VF329_03920 [Gammaproteobacteria bacterium]
MSSASARGPFTLVEECAGVGDVHWRGRVFAGIAYEIARFQGMLPSGLPVPGVHRLEGKVSLDGVPERRELVGSVLTLRLEDGRSLNLTLVADDGSVLAEGHGPSRCTCC